MEAVDTAKLMTETAFSIDTLWVLVAASLVFFMQAGFALVEAGFIRTKNTVNILMKNLVDFAFGSLAYFILGFGLMFGASCAGLIGSPNLFFSEGWSGSISGYGFLFFQTVFAATATTIVSGAMAERTHFISYIAYSIVVSLFIYPISGHWVWGNGWLASLETPFHDFAGSTVVHSVGGWIGLVGAAMLGPRIGKYNGKTNAIPGHNLTYAALGVFILWLGWFGFNPGSQLGVSGNNIESVSLIFITTNLSAAAGTVGTLVTAWLRYGKPSLSLTLNGALAGLVAITAGCNVVSPIGAIAIGLLAGMLLVFAVSFVENVLKIDDPVGASSVHGICGAFGTLMVGFFSTSTGLFYGHGFSAVISQLIGIVAVGVWAAAAGFALFFVLKKTVGLRVDKRVETEGLDVYEHGETAYN
ncbi:MAG: ammonium transporter [Breznakibacter sp.]